MVIDGNEVVTTATDQDTKYFAGDGLELITDLFRLRAAGQSCQPGKAVTGFTTAGDLSCSCLPGLAECSEGCFDLDTDAANCGACGSVCEADEECALGVCRECSPLAQNCGTEACYPQYWDGQARCTTPFEAGQQGDTCTCLNCCAKGYGCVSVGLQVGELRCARLCNPDSGTGQLYCRQLGDYTCVRASEYWGVDYIADWGFCVSPDPFSASAGRP